MPRQGKSGDNFNLLASGKPFCWAHALPVSWAHQELTGSWIEFTTHFSAISSCPISGFR